MKVSSYLLIVYLAIPQSTSFSPSPHNHVSIQHAPSCLYQTDPSRKRDKVRTLIQTTASKAVSLSKSAKTVLSGPIANVIKDVSLETGGMASEKLIEVLNRIEGTLDRVEGEVGLLRGELKGVRDVLVSNLSLEAVVDDGSVDSGVHEDSAEVQDTLGEGALEASVTMETLETDAASTEASETSTNLDLTTIDLSTLKYEDIDYTLTDMAPPFINEDECLVPGEPLVRVEKAPQNSRRIFAGIDIPVSVEEVWKVSACFQSHHDRIESDHNVMTLYGQLPCLYFLQCFLNHGKLLTNYENLQKVVPNLVVNEVLQLYSGTNDPEPIASIQSELSDAEQCREIANRMKGAVLKQVGGAKVVGINFSARTTLEVREWPYVSIVPSIHPWYS